ncbi:MAG: methyltetrahydrofolate--corrinoid methyltransferase [Candidatus Omnitrophota bacterium]|nr:MAG: methyltetrahydrofolate--corrinoid methyltransferase [Candidatus Omnitrophota bacterium]
MFIIGERINGMFKDVARAIVSRDKKSIQELAMAQLNKGADALDVNVGPASPNPTKDMIWLIQILQEITDKPLVIDSPSVAVIQESLPEVKNPVIINSTTAEDHKLQDLLPLAKQYNAKIIALTIDKGGVPKDAESRLELAVKIITHAQEAGLSPRDVYIDPVLLPVNVAQDHSPEVLKALREVKLLSDPAPATVVGLSNVSQGAKQRSLINRTFVVMALACGLDSAILDPLDDDVINAIKTAEILLNEQIFCPDYLSI